MEPIIYKPGVYKSPGVYNGAGGVYNGRGVYNDGEEINDSLIYETDFSNLDLITGIDIPIIGEQRLVNLSGSISKITKNFDDVEYNGLLLQPGARFSISFASDYDVMSAEFWVSKPSYQGLGAGCHLKNNDFWPNVPFFNCWSSGRGLGVLGYNNPISPFYSTSWGITADNIERGNVTRLIKGGTTLDRTNGIAKAFLEGKKAATRNTVFDNNCFVGVYADSSNSTLFQVFRIKVYKNVDLYEQME